MPSNFESNTSDVDYIVDATDMTTWPPSVLSYCEGKISQYSRVDDIPSEYTEHLDFLLKDYEIIAYHYTKEPFPDYYQTNGLRCLSLTVHLNDLLRNFGSRFTAQEQEIIIREVRECGEWHQPEGYLHFVYNRDDNNYGIQDFITYYGGEAIYWPFENNQTILETLRTIGRGVVVKFRLPFTDFRFTRTLTSWYISKSVSGGEFFPSEGRTNRPILPDQIICVYRITHT